MPRNTNEIPLIPENQATIRIFFTKTRSSEIKRKCPPGASKCP